MNSYNFLKFMFDIKTDDLDFRFENIFEFDGNQYNVSLKISREWDNVVRELILKTGNGTSIVFYCVIHSKECNQELVFTNIFYKKFCRDESNFPYQVYDTDNINLVLDNNIFDDIILSLKLGRKYQDHWFVLDTNNLNLVNYAIKNIIPSAVKGTNHVTI